MKKKFIARINKFLSPTSGQVGGDGSSSSVDVREEYANAFRTESYNEFWTRVIMLSDKSSNSGIPVETTTAARLPSYRLFVEHLLDPDQPTVTRIVSLIHNPPALHSLLSDYFTQTSNASLLCGLLLKDIDRTRIQYRSLKTTLQSFDTEKHFQIILTQLFEFSNISNPFDCSASSPSQVQLMQADCSNLLKQLETSRNKAKAKLQLRSRLKHSSGLFIASLTASFTIILATHALALLVAAPSFVAASVALASSRKLGRVSAQLDMAAKGTYILCRDLETITRLVARLSDEMEHIRKRVKFCNENGEIWLQSNGEVMRQLKMNDCTFNEQLNELEEHLYLCFMTINRARSLVLKEILDPGQQ
ncbi:UPF0496 protein At3g49070 [Euphorbia lathyris]|uniref:UPF0496 protein At3g49070 n=1 Tax=Euphorbia lathyris TaxID=212925 RepID=UPI003313D79D